jgi:hypothetical protein
MEARADQDSGQRSEGSPWRARLRFARGVCSRIGVSRLVPLPRLGVRLSLTGNNTTCHKRSTEWKRARLPVQQTVHARKRSLTRSFWSQEVHHRALHRRRASAGLFATRPGRLASDKAGVHEPPAGSRSKRLARRIRAPEPGQAPPLRNAYRDCI